MAGQTIAVIAITVGVRELSCTTETAMIFLHLPTEEPISVAPRITPPHANNTSCHEIPKPTNPMSSIPPTNR
eukprot:scaffold1791_cov179-Alexandrium_tamarense.AAC.3